MKWLRLNQQVYPLRQGEITIGRSAYCSIQLFSNETSREHAAISLNGDSVVISDLGSRNGTFVNGVRITEPTHLSLGAIVAIGGLYLTLVENETALESPDAAARTQETEVVPREMLETTFPEFRSNPNDAR